MRADELFTLPGDFPFASFFDPAAPPWEWVRAIRLALAGLEADPVSEVPPGLRIKGEVHIDPSVELPPFGSIEGPAWIGPGCELRPGVFIRGNVIAAGSVVLGNSSEFKNCLLLHGAQIPHFSYVGDSVLGEKAHLGAGAICSNLRFDQQPVRVRLAAGIAETGLRKLGALIGDGAEAGCNAVLQPGTVLGRKSAVAPGTAFGGTLEAGHLAFLRGTPQQVPFRQG